MYRWVHAVRIQFVRLTVSDIVVPVPAGWDVTLDLDLKSSLWVPESE